jgi:hypothetical protein
MKVLLTFGEDQLHGAGVRGEHLLAHAHDRLVAARPGALCAPLLHQPALGEGGLARRAAGQELPLQIVLPGSASQRIARNYSNNKHMSAT